LKMSKIFFSVICLLILGCEQPSEHQYRVDFEKIESEVEQAIDDQSWQVYEDEISFSYPADWFVSKQIYPDHISYLVSNTNKSIIRGAILPDDYYVYNGLDWQVDSDKYAEKFAFITVDYYPGMADDWDSIVQTVYPELVAQLEPYEVPYHANVDAIIFTKKNGLIEGNERFMAKTDNGVVDFGYILKAVPYHSSLLNYYSFICQFEF